MDRVGQRVTCLRGNVGRNVRCEADAAINRGHDRPERSDPQRHAQFVGRLGHCSRRACPFLRHARQDHVTGHRERQPQSHTDDEQRNAQRQIRSHRGEDDQRCHERRHGNADHGQPCGEHRPVREVPHRHTGEHAEHRRGHRGGQLSQACLERTVTVDELEVLGQEEHQPGETQHREQVGRHHTGEPGIREESHVDQRRRKAQLTADEQGERHRPDDAGHHDVGADTVGQSGEALLDRIDQAQHAHHGQTDAGQIPRTRVRVAVLGQQHKAADKQHHHHGDVDQEHRTPPEVFQQNASHHGAQCCACREG